MIIHIFGREKYLYLTRETGLCRFKIFFQTETCLTRRLNDNAAFALSRGLQSRKCTSGLAFFSLSVHETQSLACLKRRQQFCPITQWTLWNLALTYLYWGFCQAQIHVWRRGWESNLGNINRKRGELSPLRQPSSPSFTLLAINSLPKISSGEVDYRWKQTTVRRFCEVD